MRIIFVSIFTLSNLISFGQLHFVVMPQDDNTNIVLEDYEAPNQKLDSNKIEDEIDIVYSKFRSEGYLVPLVHRKIKSDTLFFYINCGQNHNNVKLSSGNTDLFVLGEIGYQSNDFNEIWSLKQTQKIINQLLNYYENEGFPFSRVRLNSIENTNDTLNLALSVFQGPYISIDSVIVKSDTKIPKGYIKYQLGLKKDRPYKESQLLNLDELANNEGTFRSSRPTQVLFNTHKTSIFVYLEEQSSNRISGIAGINTNEDGSVFLTGELDLALSHIFKGAEKIQFNWSAPRAGSQQLNLGIEVPYIAASPVGVIFNFDLFREDTLFSNRNFQIGLNLKPNSKAEIALSYKDQKSGNLQGGDGFSDVQTKYVLLTTVYNKLNHRFLPTKGTYINLDIGQGNRLSNEINSTQYLAGLDFKAFLTLVKNNKLYVGLSGKGLFNTPLVINELFRIGGVNSIRGFNEQSLFASQYAFTQIEYRLFLERLTYAFAFADLGFLRNEVSAIPSEDFLTGLGVGFSFYTKGGVFSLAVGVGKQTETNFDLNNSKVHIGYVNRF